MCTSAPAVQEEPRVYSASERAGLLTCRTPVHASAAAPAVQRGGPRPHDRAQSWPRTLLPTAQPPAVPLLLLHAPAGSATDERRFCKGTCTGSLPGHIGVSDNPQATAVSEPALASSSNRMCSAGVDSLPAGAAAAAASVAALLWYIWPADSDCAAASSCTRHNASTMRSAQAPPISHHHARELRQQGTTHMSAIIIQKATTCCRSSMSRCDSLAFSSACCRTAGVQTQTHKHKHRQTA